MALTVFWEETEVFHFVIQICNARNTQKICCHDMHPFQSDLKIFWNPWLPNPRVASNLRLKFKLTDTTEWKVFNSNLHDGIIYTHSSTGNALDPLVDNFIILCWINCVKNRSPKSQSCHQSQPSSTSVINSDVTIAKYSRHIGFTVQIWWTDFFGNLKD